MSSKGLVMKLSAPTSRPRRMSPGVRCAVRSTKGMERRRGSALTVWQRLNPFMPGMVTSEITMSGAAAAFLRPSSPFAATSTR